MSETTILVDDILVDSGNYLQVDGEQLSLTNVRRTKRGYEMDILRNGKVHTFVFIREDIRKFNEFSYSVAP